MRIVDILSRAKNLPDLRVDNLLLFIVQKAISRMLQKRGVVDASGRLAKPRYCKSRFVKPSKSFKTLVSVGGFGWSGSSAVVDLLSEYSGVTATYACKPLDGSRQPEPRCFEFELARSAGGLFGLERAFETHSFFERDTAIRIFAELAEMLYITHASMFGDEFVEATTRFLGKLIQARAENTGSGFDYCHHLSALGTKAVAHFLGRPSDSARKFIFYLKDLSVSEYRRLAKDYLSEVLSYIISEEILVLDQATSDDCFDVEKYQDYFGKIKTIFVWRDPRDVYTASQICGSPDANLPKDPKEFCVWYGANIKRALAVSHDLWLVVRFEDLLHSYESEVCRIEKFLEIDSAEHTKKFTALIPELSRRNSVGLWQRFHDQQSIALIYKELKDFCFVF